MKKISSAKILLVSALLALAGILAGVVLPWLISAKSDLAVGCGIGLLFSAVVGIAFAVNSRLGSAAAVALLAVSAQGCSKVPAGNVGVKVYLLGSSKGVDHEVLGVGRYWIGINEELYLFPTFQQNYTWVREPGEGAPDESLWFQTKEGMQVNADVGITYHLDPSKIAVIFQKYRKGVGEITDIYLRNHVRDALVSLSSKMSVEDVYGNAKEQMIDEAQKIVSETVGPEGIIVDKLYLIGAMRLPPNVVGALNAKIQATQEAQQRENEVQKARAEAEIKIAQARGDAESTLLKAKAEAEANRLKQQTLTDELIRYEATQKWNGQLPQITSGAIPFVNINK